MNISVKNLKRIFANYKILSSAEVATSLAVRAGTKAFKSLEDQLLFFEKKRILTRVENKYKLAKPYLTGVFYCGRSNRNFVINKATKEKKWVKNDFWQAQSGDEVHYEELSGFGFGGKPLVVVREKIFKKPDNLSLLVKLVKNSKPIFKPLNTDDQNVQKIEVGGDLPKLADGMIILATPVEKKKDLLICCFYKIAGDINDLPKDTYPLLNKNDIRLSFPQKVLAEASALDENITMATKKERRDLRKLNLITIDPWNSKDFDDAIYVSQETSTSYRLVVAIADVSHFVTENSALDEEAYWRGASLYLLNKVIPMLPHRLSDDLCSLKAGFDRFAQVADMIIDDNGKTISYEIYPAIINSHRRCNYDEVNAFFANQKMKNSTIDTQNCLRTSKKLHVILRKMMKKRGFVDFDVAEGEIAVDAKGNPISVEVRARGEAQKMIEDFMIRANECVAQHFAQKVLPAIYRVHEKPSLKKFQRLQGILKLLKLTSRFPKKNKVTPTTVQNLITEVRHFPHHEIISGLLLRSMEKARYDVQNKGHFGLASACYTHFTSPIRRYPDLIVHRLLRTYFFEQHQDPKTKNHFGSCLPAIAEQCSLNEVKIVNTERAVNDLKKAQYMLSKKDEQFEGVITTVTFFGFFVQLYNTIEGLVPVKSLVDDYYAYLPEKEMLKGVRWKQKIQVGDFVSVKCANVDLRKGQVEFSLVKHTDNSIWNKKTDGA